MSPFEPVVIDKACEEVVAEIRVEAGIVLVRITPGLPRWRECVFRACAVDHAERGQRYQCFLHGVAQAFFRYADAHVLSWEQFLRWIREELIPLCESLHP